MFGQPSDRTVTQVYQFNFLTLTVWVWATVIKNTSHFKMKSPEKATLRELTTNHQSQQRCFLSLSSFKDSLAM